MVRSTLRLVHLIEDSLLISLLIGMIVLASGQIFLRNFFDIGFTWIDPLLRVMVMWTGLIGATVASRDNKHIRIDLIGRYLPRRTNLVLQIFVGLFVSFICMVIGWFAARWVWMDFEDAFPAFAGIPGWWLEIIIPIAFALIAIRYLIHSVVWARMLFSGQET